MRLPLTCALFAAALASAAPDDFVPLFDGSSLKGWKLVNGRGPGYVAKDGIIVCPADGGGNLFTEKEYANFIFRFEYRLSPGGNNGVDGQFERDTPASVVETTGVAGLG